MVIPGIVGGLVAGFADRRLPYCLGLVFLIVAGLLWTRGMNYFDLRPECCGPAFERRLFEESFVEMNWIVAPLAYCLGRWMKRVRTS